MRGCIPISLAFILSVESRFEQRDNDDDDPWMIWIKGSMDDNTYDQLVAIRIVAHTPSWRSTQNVGQTRD